MMLLWCRSVGCLKVANIHFSLEGFSPTLDQPHSAPKGVHIQVFWFDMGGIEKSHHSGHGAIIAITLVSFFGIVLHKKILDISRG